MSLSTSVAALLDAYMSEVFPATHAPGMQVVVVDKDSMRYARAFGDAVSTNQVTGIGSLTKSMTALAIQQLGVDRQAPVTQYLANLHVPDWVTIDRLLTHTSGIATQATLDNIIVNAPGAFEYANLNYHLLGLVIQAVSGENYDYYMRKHVFEPLGMWNTTADLGRVTDLLTGHTVFFGKPVPWRMERFFPNRMNNEARWGNLSAGFVLSTAHDMGIYLQHYLNNGVPEVPDGGYRDGWFRDGDRIFHAGSLEGYSSFMMLLPELGVGVVVLTNMQDYVGNTMSGLRIEAGITNILAGRQPSPVDRGLYLRRHGLLSALYLTIMALPLVRCRHKTIWNVVLPTALLSVPRIVKARWATVWGFAPNLLVSLVASATLLYAGWFTKKTKTR